MKEASGACRGLWEIRDFLHYWPGLVALCFYPVEKNAPFAFFVAGTVFFATLRLCFLTGAGLVHLLPAACVPRETVDFCCDSDILFMATALVETNRQIDPGLEVFPLCPSKGFLECSPQAGFQHVNERRMHALPSLLYSCLSYPGFWFKCSLG